MQIGAYLLVNCIYILHKGPNKDSRLVITSPNMCTLNNHWFTCWLLHKLQNDINRKCKEYNILAIYHDF